MKYVSTRDAAISCTFEEAICSGYAPDGGLFVPESLPQVDATIMAEWSKLSYSDLSKEILRLFISADEIPDTDLTILCQSTLAGFPEMVVPIEKVGPLYVAELFHGPTFCFKDLGMGALVNLLSYFATKRQQNTTLLVSTTGDTGPACLQAVSDVNNPYLTLLVHYPKGQISDFQRKQLTTSKSNCVKVAAFEGGGDDMDLPIKNILAKSKGSGRRVTGANSYNIGRPIMQMVHFIWAYLRVAETLNITPGDMEKKIDFILPTGAMGNIAGGYIAKRMGVPIGNLCSGVNCNDITHRVIQTGKFHKSPVMLKTLSDAINIQLPYNFERLLFYLTDCNHNWIKEFYANVELHQKNDLTPDLLTLLQKEFQSARITDDEMCTIMQKVDQQFGYFLCPNTAVAFGAAEKLGYIMNDTKLDPPRRPAIVLATASPSKFEESVTIALQEEGWKRYRDSSFPPRAQQILQMDEVEPVLYTATPGMTLEEVQLQWEKKAMEILHELCST